MKVDRSQYDLSRSTSPDFGDDAATTLVVLLPVGSVEPHGPHLSLVTDTVISVGAAYRAAPRLEALGVTARVAPAVPYGVTNCAAGFPGAVSVAGPALATFLASVAEGFHRTGAAHVCIINNHLEPAQDRAVREAAAWFPSNKVSVACPLSRKWARNLSAEFKSGQCHAGRYETSLVLAEQPELVDERARAVLPEVAISLSNKLKMGIDTFTAMGLDQAYAGDPATATAEEGEQQFQHLAAMIVGEVSVALALSA